MPRPRKAGGVRQGAPGKTYPNRTDLNAKPRAQPVRVGPSQQYGQGAEQMAAQQAVPLPQAPPIGAPMGQQPIPLGAPSERPNEPLTAGLPMGAGPGPESLPNQFNEVPDDTIGPLLRGLYLGWPTEEIRQLIEYHDAHTLAQAPNDVAINPISPGVTG